MAPPCDVPGRWRMRAVAPLQAPGVPPREGGMGPLTHARLKRLALIYLLFASMGLLLAQCASTPGLQAFGLGRACGAARKRSRLAGGRDTPGCE